MFSRRSFLLAIGTATSATGWTPLHAAESHLIVALGASNTAGRGRGKTNGGVDAPFAFPAQLQSLLRARGINATVRNAGIAGDTTGGMLKRLSRAVPNGTKLVILQPGGNDARREIDEADTSANISEIKRLLAARNIQVIMLESLVQIAGKSNRDPDGQHFNAAGHLAMAEYLVPRIVSALR